MALVNIVRDYDESQSGAAGAEPGSPPPQWDSAALFRDRDDQQMAYEEPLSAPTQGDDFAWLQPRSPVAPPSSQEEPALSESSFLDGYTHLFGEHSSENMFCPRFT